MGNIFDTLFVRAKRAALLSIAFGCTIFSLVSASAAPSVTLAWDPSTSPDVAGYNIYYGTTSGSYPSKIPLGNVTTTTISGLVAGTTYYFVATAYSSLGLESTPSNELPYTVPTAPSNSTNQPPTLNLISAVTINEDVGQQTINLSGITSGAANENQTLTVTATSSNPSLVPNPTVNYTGPNTTGNLSFTPVANASGSAVITVTVNDNQSQNNLTSRTFTVTVNAVNDATTLNSIANVTINENAGQQTVNVSGITSGAANENQNLTVTATSSNPSLVPNPTVNYTSPNTTGNLSFTPVANASGTAVITVTVNDNQSQNNLTSRSFTLTVNAVNDAPTLNSVANVTINEDAGQQTISLSGITTGTANENQNLTVTATSSNPSLVPNPAVNYTSPNTTGNLSFTPVANASGSAVITVTVNDNQSQNNLTSRTFTVTVNTVNDAPTLNSVANVTINEDAGQQTINLSGITSGAANENQTLTVTATSSNPSLVPNPAVNYTSPNTTGNLSFTPVANASGSAVITVTVNDNQSQNNLTSRSLTVTVNPVNPGQTSTTVTNQSVPGSGTYNGLFFEDTGVQQNSAGCFTLSVTTKGSYSGKIQIGSAKYSFSGKTNSASFITNTITRKGASPLTIVLWTAGGNPSAEQIFGQLTDGTWISTLSGDKAVFSKTKWAPFAGNYTMVIPQDKDQPFPMGYGFGTLQVSSSGVANFTGTLADGTSISQSATISADGSWPLYIPLYSGRGSTISWISFTNHSSYDLSGLLSWINPSNPKAKFYSSGFTNESTVIGSDYIAPVGKTSPFSRYTNILVNGVDFNAANPGSVLPKLSITTKNGNFNFTAKNSATNKKISYGGVIFQRLNAGYGMYLDADQTSKSLVIAP